MFRRILGNEPFSTLLDYRHRSSMISFCNPGGCCSGSMNDEHYAVILFCDNGLFIRAVMHRVSFDYRSGCSGGTSWGNTLSGK